MIIAQCVDSEVLSAVRECKGFEPISVRWQEQSTRHSSDVVTRFHGRGDRGRGQTRRLAGAPVGQSDLQWGKATYTGVGTASELYAS